MKPPKRREIVNRASMSVYREPDKIYEFRGTKDDFLEMAACHRRILEFLERPDAEKLLAANPDLEALLYHWHELAVETSARLRAFIRFASLGERVGPKYGLSVDEFWDLVQAQNWSCSICGQRFEHTGEHPNVDHNHETQEVRGMLCRRCNTGLGMFRDSPDLLDAAMQYLEDRGCYGTDALKADQ